LYLLTEGGSGAMQNLLARLVGWRLQYILVVAFVFTTAVTIAVGTPVTYTVINNYLAGAQDARVGRDMNLAEQFYELKLHDISATAQRLSTGPEVRANLAAANEGVFDAVQAVELEIDNELSVLPTDAQRFVLAIDANGKTVIGRMCCRDKEVRLATPNADWSSLPIIADALSKGQPQAATEVVSADVLRWVGLDQQARIELLPTEKAAPQPFNPAEGSAGLTVMGVAPVKSPDGQVLGAIVAGHLLNNDFTLVDRIRDVAGVDTVTVFFGDLRVSTNVLDKGERAIGTRVSQEVFDKVLLNGEEFTGPAYVVNQWYISRYRPLYNHQGEIVGILYVGAKQSTFQRLLDSFRRQVFLIALFTGLLAVLIAIPVSWSISRPLTELADATRKVAQGDWSVRVPVFGHGETGILAESFNTMVGTLKETQEQLVQKEKLASVGQLAAGVAHEINNPLGSVLLYADILRKETPEEDEQQRADLEMIMSEATRCKTIVNDLLNFSRQNQVLAQATDLNAILQEMAEEARKQDMYRDIDLVEDLSPDLPTIQADPLQIRQVFLNLMSNAAEAMREGGRLTLRTKKGPGEGWVTVEVADTGVGISPENMKKLFTPFFTTKPIGKGTGLGLAIIYGIVKMHRGQISVQSEVGQGTTFTITLREHLPTQTLAAEGSFVA
jgi:two-component system NtrC family sensor kinase